MAKIYALANCVVVWLGEAAENSDQALHWIRGTGGGQNSESSSCNETIQKAIIALFQRPWFRRIWILQEVAAARQISIICGYTEIDGYAFCLGMDSFEGFNKARVDLQNLARAVTYLIRGAIFRPDFSMSNLGRTSLHICPIGELMDMYHTHEATKRHDKVFALLGMSSDNLSESELLPDYKVPWGQLLRRLTKYILCKEIYVESWGDDREIAVIKGKGLVLGRVFLVQSDTVQEERDGVNVSLRNIWGSTRWNLQAPAQPVGDGDILCLLQGASRPTIVRQRQDFFDVVVIAARPPERIPVRGRYIEWPKRLQSGLLFIRDFLLVWNWETSLEKFQYLKKYARASKLSTEFASGLDKATSLWNIALMLEDLNEYGKADEKFEQAIEGYVGSDYRYIRPSERGLTSLSWAAENGFADVVSSLLTKTGVDPDWKGGQHGQTPLLRAAMKGHEVVVNLLLKSGKVEADSKDAFGRTPLSWASEGGHETVVKLLLETGKVEVNSKDYMHSRAPLSWAAEGGHEIVVKLLLETDKVEVHSKDSSEQTPLSRAAREGHEAVVKLLLEEDGFEINSLDYQGRTVFSLATEGGHEAVVKLLLETGKVEINLKDYKGRTSLSLAVEGGHEAVVKLLQSSTK